MCSSKNFLPLALCTMLVTRAAFAVPILPPLPVAPPPEAAPAAPSPDATASASAETVLYNGQPLPQAGLSVASWGGGNGEESSETFLFNGHALRVTTLDEFQGARINFAAPVSLEGLSAKENLVLQITLRLGTPTLHYRPAAPRKPVLANPPGEMPLPGQMPTMPMPRPMPMREPMPSAPGGTFPGVQPLVPASPSPAVLIPQIQNLRLLFTLADGRQADVLCALPDVSDETVGDGWKTINVPLGGLSYPAALSGAAPEALQSITLGGDHYGLFYIGRMKVVDDEIPITAILDVPPTVAAGATIRLRSHADSGLSQLHYSWDFDASDGITEQATGPDATTSYAAGDKDYTVTLTVTDVGGVKKPVQATAKIHVNP